MTKDFLNQKVEFLNPNVAEQLYRYEIQIDQELTLIKREPRNNLVPRYQSILIIKAICF